LLLGAAYLASNYLRRRFDLDYWTGVVPVATGILVPVVAVLVVLERTIARQRVREELRRRGCCQGCGRDLRATPDRCPECGKMVAGA
jgi:hypothetical protein